MSKVLDPSKELRFTRSTQALIFYIFSAISLAGMVTLSLITATIYKMDGDLKEIPFPIWLIILPTALFIAFLYLAQYCARHPYLLLSPMGVEIFPFWKPVKNFQLITWGEIAVVEFKEFHMVLHFTQEKKSGVVLTLSPLNMKSRMLLQKALEGVMKQQKK